MKTKQVIIIRKDLKMRKGKIASQAAHASMKVFFDIMTCENDVYSFKLPASEVGAEIKNWIDGSFTKITVGVNDLQTLLQLYEDAKQSNLLCALIEDNGLTEFSGNKTITALAIGPAAVDKIDQITANLPLL